MIASCVLSNRRMYHKFNIVGGCRHRGCRKGGVFGEGRKQRRTGRLDHLRGMSSGAKRLVQSLRGRSGGGRGGGGGGRGEGGGGEGSGGGGGGASTSATRLCHYDSGHELDEISVVGAAIRGSEGLPTPTTPCHCGGLKYGSGQTLYSIAGLVPPAPAAPAHGAQSGERFSIRKFKFNFVF